MSSLLDVLHLHRTQPEPHLQLLDVHGSAARLHPLAPAVDEVNRLLPASFHLLPAVAQPVDLVFAYDDLFNGDKRGIRQNGAQVIQHGVDFERHVGRVGR